MAEVTVYYEGPIVTKSQARARGLKHYFTGKPCKYHHVDKRFVSSGACFHCITLHYKRWRTENTDKVSAATLAWMRAHPEETKANRRASYHRNKDAINERQRQRRKDNPREYHRRDAERYPRIRDRVIRRATEWARANPDSRANTRAKRRSVPGVLDKGDIERLLTKQRGRCANCSKSIRRKYHVDHVTPIAKGGANVIGNVQLLCPTCNHKKSAKDPIEFAREQGRLL